MTDEEKAEEYVNSNGFGSDYNNIDSNEANEEIRQAYPILTDLQREGLKKVYGLGGDMDNILRLFDGTKQ